MTLLTIIQEAADLLGLPQPQSAAGSADLTTRKLVGFANQAGKHLAGYHDWQDLIVEQSFISLATQEQTNALPPVDYDRLVYNPSIWDRTNNTQIAGPAPQRYWQRLKSGVITSGPNGCWRILGSQLNVLPVLEAGHTLEFEYISKRWARSSDGDAQLVFLADTDTAALSEDLFVLEIIWRWRQSRGFAQYAEDMSTCEREKEKKASADRGTGRIRVEPNDTGPSNYAPNITPVP